MRAGPVRSPATQWTLMLKPGLRSGGCHREIVPDTSQQDKAFCTLSPPCTVGKTPVQGWHSMQGQQGLEAMGIWTEQWVGASKELG